MSLAPLGSTSVEAPFVPEAIALLAGWEGLEFGLEFGPVPQPTKVTSKQVVATLSDNGSCNESCDAMNFMDSTWLAGNWLAGNWLAGNWLAMGWLA